MPYPARGVGKRQCRVRRGSLTPTLPPYSYSIKPPQLYTSDFRERQVNEFISTINLSIAKEEKTHGTSKNRRILS